MSSMLETRTPREGATSSVSVIRSWLTIRHDAAVPQQRRGELDNALLLAIMGAETHPVSDTDQWFKAFDGTLGYAHWVADHEDGNWVPVPVTIPQFDIAKLATDAVTQKSGAEAAAQVAGAYRDIVKLRQEAAGLTGVLGFGSVPSREALVLLAGSRVDTKHKTALEVNLVALAFAVADGVDADDVLTVRPRKDIAQAFIRFSRYAIDTAEKDYDAVQKEIVAKLGDRSAKYIHRSPVVSQ
jgi:hypothetical protein